MTTEHYNNFSVILFTFSFKVPGTLNINVEILFKHFNNFILLSGRYHTYKYTLMLIKITKN